MKKMKFDLCFAAAKTILAAFAISSGVMAALVPVSCRLTEEGIEILPGDKECPKLEGFSVSGAKSVSISFSEKVLLSEVEVTENAEGSEFSAVPEKIDYDETGTVAEINFSEATVVGRDYLIRAVATDLSGNTTEIGLTFAGYNENPAVMVLNEIRTKYDAAKKLSDFVEFYVLKGGNTYGCKLKGAQKGVDFDYAFPAMEVKTGEYIVLHNKRYENSEEIQNELDDRLELSIGNESCGTARDLWRDGTENVFTNNDVLVLMNECGNQIMDGILLYEFKGSGWSKNLQKEYAQLLFECGVWNSGSEADYAVNTASATTVYRSISRINLPEIIEKFETGEKISSSAENWKLTEKTTVNKVVISGATPGFENSTNYLN